MPSQRRRTSNAVTARGKVWLESGGTYAFGWGISEILKAVERAGSIKGAAAIVGKSYRHVWTRIKEAEHALGVPLVETTVGGNEPRRSELTPAAETLVRQFDRLRSRVFQLVEKESALMLQVIRDTRKFSDQQR